LTVSNSGLVLVFGDNSFFSVGQLSGSSGVLNVLSGGSLTVAGVPAM
jgi:hypothetical protein